MKERVSLENCCFTVDKAGLFYSYKEKPLAQQRACRNNGPVARMAEMKEYPTSLGITDFLRIRVLVEKLL